MNITSLIQKKTKKEKDTSDVLSGPKILIFTPSVDGKLYGNCAQSIVDNCQLLQKKLNSYVRFQILAKCPYLHHARNVACKVAIIHEYDYLIFIDSDVEFEVDAIYKLIMHDKDICVGAYPHKTLDKPSFVVNPVPRAVPDSNGLLKVEQVGTGFMCIKTDALKKMYPEVQEYIYVSNTGHNANEHEEEFYRAFFNFSYDDRKKLVSEDWYFCDTWRNVCGGDIYLDTNIKLKHEGYHVFEGNLDNWLSNFV